jgi:hypothetical protein
MNDLVNQVINDVTDVTVFEKLVFGLKNAKL